MSTARMSTAFVPTFGNVAFKRLIRLAINPWSLLCALLLVNALARPYSDLIHDARLYAVQVLNRTEPGLYADDLYLRYGSQDSFSVFSRLIGPVVKQIGLRDVFFAFYLLSNALFLYGAQRFISTVVRRKLIAALALIYVAVNPITFGGLGVFHVNETFLTPRITAVGLVLLGLTRLYDSRWLSLAIIGLAFMVHPIMSFSGLLVWIYVVSLSVFTARQVCLFAGVGGLALAILLTYFPWGSAVFGPMDATWRAYVHAANFYATPSEWLSMDWVRIAAAFAITAIARNCLGYSAATRRLLDGIMVVAFVGAAGSVVVPHLPYALTFQGQPYRALWLLQFVQIPLLVDLLRHVWLRGLVPIRPWVAVAVSAFAVAVTTPIQLLSPVGLLLMTYVRRVVSHRYSGWVRFGLIWAAGLAAVLCVLPVFAPFFVFRDKMLGLPTPIDLLRFVPLAMGPLYTWLFALIFAGWLCHRVGRGRQLQVTALIGCLAVQGMYFKTSELPLWNGGLSEHNASVAFVKQLIDERLDTGDRLPTVYWPNARLDDLWVTLSVKSYFTKQQTAGSMFNRGTALEGQRRADIVQPFEMKELKRDRYQQKWIMESLRRVYGSIEYAEPTLADLYRLCCEDVDLAVVQHEFPGLHCATVGPFFVYECQKIREQVREQLREAGDPVSRSLITNSGEPSAAERKTSLRLNTSFPAN